MIISRNEVIIATLTGLTGMFLKLLYATSDHNNLIFMLSPVQFLIQLIFNTNSSFDSAIGFYFADLNIIIDKSCAGVNFWIIAFWTSISILLIQSPRLEHKFAISIGLFLISYCFTIVVNTSRIIISIVTLQLKGMIPFIDSSWFHQAQGAFIYLFFLLLFSLGLNYSLHKSNITHAQRI